MPIEFVICLGGAAVRSAAVAGLDIRIIDAKSATENDGFIIVFLGQAATQKQEAHPQYFYFFSRSKTNIAMLDPGFVANFRGRSPPSFVQHIFKVLVVGS